MSDAAAFVVSFARADLFYLAAAVPVDRKGVAWFDFDTSGVRLSVASDQLGLVRSLDATVSIPAANLPVTGFGVATAELPSVVRQAAIGTWTRLDLEVIPNHDTGTVVQDRTALTGGIPYEDGLLAGLLDEHLYEPDHSYLTLCWDRPSVLDRLKPAEAGNSFHIPSFRECLGTADKLIPGNAGNPQYEVLEIVDGIAHAGALNLCFSIEAPALKGITLHLHRSQIGPLAALLERFDPLSPNRIATTSQYHLFTDNLTTVYAAAPSARPPQQASDVLANRPNTQATFQSTPIKGKLTGTMRSGRGAQVRNRVLRMALTDGSPPTLIMEAYSWSTAKQLGRAKVPPLSSETIFDVLTEQVLLEKVLTACNGQIAIQSSTGWLYIRSIGQFTRLTAKLRAYPRDQHRLQTQVAGLIPLA